MKANCLLKKFLGISLYLIWPLAHAEVIPESYSTDQHIQVANYNSNQVYRINAMQGFISSIQFGNDEKILSVNIGDSSSWLISVQNDMVNLKPTADQPDTNLNVLTTRGTYQFLLTAPAKIIDSTGKLVRRPQKNTVFLLRFHYPDENQSALTTGNSSSKKPWVKNTHYSARGNSGAAPFFVFDDGKFTYFYFGKQKDFPAIFTVDMKGNESTVNYHLQGNYVVVETLSSQFTLRNGNQIASVFNDN